MVAKHHGAVATQRLAAGKLNRPVKVRGIANQRRAVQRQPVGDDNLRPVYEAQIQITVERYAVQQVVPNSCLNLSANSLAAVSPSSNANVVEPLPDISVAEAP